MGRRRTFEPLKVLINGRAVGTLAREPSGAVSFLYDESWLAWEHQFPISLSLPLRPTSYRGDAVTAVFDNLLPDNADIRRRVAERVGAAGVDPFSLLFEIGRDCVGAMQFLPESEAVKETEKDLSPIKLSNDDIGKRLAGLARAPLGINEGDAFRISVAGAQEKTALLKRARTWYLPRGTQPTTHILKPSIGKIETANGVIDMTLSSENEHYCLRILEGFGLRVAKTRIETFGARTTLVVERFDRKQTADGHWIRLPQEDFCQALGIPSSRKYQAEGGPSAAEILKLLRASDHPERDQSDVFKSLILFWLIGATDGHAKNYSLFLKPGGGFELTPFYDVLSLEPAFQAGRIPHNSYKLALSAGARPKYKILELHGRHFIETAKKAGLGQKILRDVFEDIHDRATKALDHAADLIPSHALPIHQTIAAAIKDRLPLLTNTGKAD
jgi:serine/threonine-protein kinase HipA